MSQKGKSFKVLLSTICIEGKIKCKTGLHIGGSSDTIEIGGIDTPVIRDPITNMPYIPGSSLKGKLRSLVEKTTIIDGRPLIANRNGGDKNKMVWRHECENLKDAVKCPVCRVFGSTGEKGGDNWPAMLRVQDGGLLNPDDLVREGLPVFEAKMENTLDRLTSAAHPRCIERVPAGAAFALSLIYRHEAIGGIDGEDHDSGPSTDELDTSLKKEPCNCMEEDLTNILMGLKLIELDGLGGNVSRGSGGVEILITSMKAVIPPEGKVVSLNIGENGESPEAVKKRLSDFINLVDNRLTKKLEHHEDSAA